MSSLRQSSAAIMLLGLALAVTPAAAQQTGNPDFPPSPIEITSVFPESVPAGTPFVLRLRIQNTSAYPLTIQAFNPFPGLSGEHAGSYYARNCSDSCVLRGTVPTPPGEEILVELATLYYRNSELFSGDVFLSGLRVTAMVESGDAQIFSYSARSVSTDPVHVIHDPNAPGVTPDDDAIPARAPLELRDLAVPGDQLLVHDPNTGNDWIRLPQTTDLTEESLAEATAPGGEYEGFSVAYAAQVEQLTLNHVHADGVDVRAWELSDHSLAGLRASMSAFIEMIGETREQPLSSSVNTAGAVRDRSPLLSSQVTRHRVIELLGNREDNAFVSSNTGLHQRYLAQSIIEFSSSFGVWLVRPPQPLPQRPEDRASYLFENLVVPDVQVDGSHYRVHMLLENEVSGRLRLTGLDPRPASAHAVPFDPDQGTLTLEDAVWLDAEGTARQFDLQLTYLPGSEPAVFHVTRLEEKAGD